MAVHRSDDPGVRSLAGLHLYHFGLSNCSQRVRMALAEKGLTWTSHPVDMVRAQNTRPGYHAIHPRGLVPALVHDGTVILESLDILRYLDERLPGPALMPGEAERRAEVQRWMERAGAVQGAIKVLTHEVLLAPTRPWRAWQLRRGRVPHDPDLRRFHERFAAGAIPAAEVQRARGEMTDAVDALEAHLAARRPREWDPWLVGPTFTLADVAWAVNLHRLDLMRFPLAAYPAVAGWHRALAARPSYRTALVEHEPRPLLALFRLTSRRASW